MNFFQHFTVKKTRLTAERLSRLYVQWFAYMDAVALPWNQVIMRAAMVERTAESTADCNQVREGVVRLIY